MGVDLFFVLSGFLITRILLETREEKHYWSEFYIKRAGRILPPLLIVLPLGILLSSKKVWFAIAGYVFFLGNYVDTTQYAMWAFLPLWSLAVEEHFYLVWPSVVRWLRPSICTAIVLCVLIGEPILRVIFAPLVRDASIIGYLTWFRLDSITAGCLIALTYEIPFVHNLLRRGALALFAAVVATYCLLQWRYADAFTHTSNSILFNALGFSLVSLGAFALVAHLIVVPKGILARIFSVPAIVFMGEISYGVYLLHPITRAILRRVFHAEGESAGHSYQALVLFLINMVVVSVLAWLSFRFYETPILRLSREKARALRASS